MRSAAGALLLQQLVLAHKAEAAQQQHERGKAQDDSKRDHGANDAHNHWALVRRIVRRTRRRSSCRRRRRRTCPLRCRTPCTTRGPCARQSWPSRRQSAATAAPSPAGRTAAQRRHRVYTARQRAVVEAHAHAYVLGAREQQRGARHEELKGHGRREVQQAVKVGLTPVSWLRPKKLRNAA